MAKILQHTNVRSEPEPSRHDGRSPAAGGEPTHADRAVHLLAARLAHLTEVFGDRLAPGHGESEKDFVLSARVSERIGQIYRRYAAAEDALALANVPEDDSVRRVVHHGRSDVESLAQFLSQACRHGLLDMDLADDARSLVEFGGGTPRSVMTALVMLPRQVEVTAESLAEVEGRSDKAAVLVSLDELRRPATPPECVDELLEKPAVQLASKPEAPAEGGSLAPLVEATSDRTLESSIGTSEILYLDAEGCFSRTSAQVAREHGLDTIRVVPPFTDLSPFGTVSEGESDLRCWVVAGETFTVIAPPGTSVVAMEFTDSRGDAMGGPVSAEACHEGMLRITIPDDVACVNYRVRRAEGAALEEAAVSRVTPESGPAYPRPKILDGAVAEARTLVADGRPTDALHLLATVYKEVATGYCKTPELKELYLAAGPNCSAFLHGLGLITDCVGHSRSFARLCLESGLFARVAGGPVYRGGEAYEYPGHQVVLVELGQTGPEALRGTVVIDPTAWLPDKGFELRASAREHCEKLATRIASLTPDEAYEVGRWLGQTAFEERADARPEELVRRGALPRARNPLPDEPYRPAEALLSDHHRLALIEAGIESVRNGDSPFKLIKALAGALREAPNLFASEDGAFDARSVPHRGLALIRTLVERGPEGFEFPRWHEKLISESRSLLTSYATPGPFVRGELAALAVSLLEHDASPGTLSCVMERFSSSSFVSPKDPFYPGLVKAVLTAVEKRGVPEDADRFQFLEGLGRVADSILDRPRRRDSDASPHAEILGRALVTTMRATGVRIADLILGYDDKGEGEPYSPLSSMGTGLLSAFGARGYFPREVDAEGELTSEAKQEVVRRLGVALAERYLRVDDVYAALDTLENFGRFDLKPLRSEFARVLRYQVEECGVEAPRPESPVSVWLCAEGYGGEIHRVLTLLYRQGGLDLASPEWRDDWPSHGTPARQLAVWTGALRSIGISDDALRVEAVLPATRWDEKPETGVNRVQDLFLALFRDPVLRGIGRRMLPADMAHLAPEIEAIAQRVTPAKGSFMAALEHCNLSDPASSNYAMGVYRNLSARVEDLRPLERGDVERLVEQGIKRNAGFKEYTQRRTELLGVLGTLALGGADQGAPGGTEFVDSALSIWATSALADNDPAALRSAMSESSLGRELLKRFSEEELAILIPAARLAWGAGSRSTVVHAVMAAAPEPIFPRVPGAPESAWVRQFNARARSRSAKLEGAELDLLEAKVTERWADMQRPAALGNGRIPHPTKKRSYGNNGDELTGLRESPPNLPVNPREVAWKATKDPARPRLKELKPPVMQKRVGEQHVVLSLDELIAPNPMERSELLVPIAARLLNECRPGSPLVVHGLRGDGNLVTFRLDIERGFSFEGQEPVRPLARELAKFLAELGGELFDKYKGTDMHNAWHTPVPMLRSPFRQGTFPKGETVKLFCLPSRFPHFLRTLGQFHEIELMPGL